VCTSLMPADLTKHEAAVYDRQLRVWGVAVQKRYVGVPPSLSRDLLCIS